MSERQIVAILTAIVRAKDQSLDPEDAILQAIAIARGGMSQAELLDAVAVIARDGSRSQSAGAGCTAVEILRDVDYTLGVRAAARVTELQRLIGRNL